MESTTAIKKGPSDFDNDDFLERDYSMDLMKYSQFCDIKGGQTTGIKGKKTTVSKKITSTAAFSAAAIAIVSEKPNVITVSVPESFKTVEEKSFIKQLILEEKQKHDPALILPTELELYAKKDKLLKIKNKMVNENMFLHACRKNCGKNFKTLTERALHETHEHEHKMHYRIIKCNFCQEIFNNFFDLTRHIPKHRNSGFICSHCSLPCESYLDLQNHRKTSESCNNFEKKSSSKETLDTFSLKDEEKTEINSKKPTKRSSEHSSPSKDIKEKDLFFNITLKPDLPLLPLTTFSMLEKPPSTSYKDEVKEFAAKYQLKSVAKKRTSYKETTVAKKHKNLDWETNIAIPKCVNDFPYPMPNIKIKEEPIDYDETTNNNLIQIKNEPFDESELNEMNFENNNDAFEANTNQKNLLNNQSWQNILIKDEPQNETIEENTLLRNSETWSFKSFENNNNGVCNIKPNILLNKSNLMAMKNIKILKLAPNAKIVKLSPNLTIPNIKIESLQNKLIKQETTNKFIPIKLSSPTANVSNECNEHHQSEEKEQKDCKSDLWHFKEHLTNKINRLPDWLLRFMENQPEQQKIIEQYQHQFKNTSEEIPLSSNNLALDSSTILPSITSPIKKEPIDSTLKTPKSFFGKFSDFSDKELMIARRQFNDYSYNWLCPKCDRKYASKHTFMNHVIGVHKISNNELKDLIVEIKPFPSPTVEPEKKISSTRKKKQNVCDASVNQQSVIIETKCPKCEQSFRKTSRFEEHLKNNCERPTHICAVCSKAFFNRGTLNCHMTIHTGALPFKCNFCEKRFRTRGQVTVHHRTHTGEKPFTCQICFQSFTHRETLLSHLSRHTGIKRYRCNGCGKHFSSVSGLTTHRKNRKMTCGLIKLDTRAVGPRIRVVSGQVYIEPQKNVPDENFPILADIQNTLLKN